jgi:glycosyltransferase involved in cell wall biosynthesis
MMDDWPSIISTKGLFRKFWKKKINNEFRQLLNNVDLHLSICDAMSEEYKLRYGIDFLPFHNTVNPEVWLPFRKTSFELDKIEYIILFSGRIGRGIENSFFEVAAAIESLVRRGQCVKLHIQSPNLEQRILDRLTKFKCVHINPEAEYSLIPKLYSNADILVIANDFNEEGIKFLKFSMPTKAPEYMISGTPVLVYASSETAVSKFFSKNKCGYCVTNQSSEELADAIEYLLSNPDFRKELSENAINYAQDTFSSTKVRAKFKQLLCNLVMRDKPSD